MFSEIESVVCYSVNNHLNNYSANNEYLVLMFQNAFDSTAGVGEGREARGPRAGPAVGYKVDWLKLCLRRPGVVCSASFDYD